MVALVARYLVRAGREDEVAQALREFAPEGVQPFQADPSTDMNEAVNPRENGLS